VAGHREKSHYDLGKLRIERWIAEADVPEKKVQWRATIDQNDTSLEYREGPVSIRLKEVDEFIQHLVSLFVMLLVVDNL